MSSKVSCAPWQDLLLGSATTYSATYDECSPDTVVISTNAVTASGATSDNQEIVYQELCGNGQLIAKVSALSGGYAGLFVRESNAAGARKGAIMTQKGSTVFRHLRSTTDGIQLQASYMASGHQWLKINRSGTQVVGSWSTNGTSWNVAFNTALSMTDCVVIGMAAFSTSSGTTINATFTNISVAQSDTIPATEVAFADSTLEAQGGDTVEICVNLQNPCYCSPVTVDVALATDSLPHLIGFEPQTLTFVEGDTVECFTVVLEEADTNGTYTFELTNLEGGNDSEIGAIGELVLEVEANEEEEEAPAFGVCGKFYKAPPEITDSSALLFSDRFGNIYLAEELALPESPLEACGCDEFTDIPHYEENYFELHFQDCIADIDTGFNDNILGAERRRAACKAFAYLSHLIQRNANPCDEEAELPNIQVHIKTMPTSNSQPLAGATPVYELSYYASNGGIIDGLPWKIINNPGYSNQSNGIYHGIMEVNFNNDYHLADTSDVPVNQFDLYTVMLHEGLHILGFASAIKILDGDYFFAGINSYTRYDSHLELEDGTPLVMRHATLPYRWILNPAIDIETDLHASCTDDPGPQMEFASFQSMATFPIYTGDYTTGQDESANQGSSFSHLNDSCVGALAPYLMDPFIPIGERLDLIEEGEKRILCDLGYRVLDMEDCSCSVAGNHDPVMACSEESFVFTLCEDSTSFTIHLEDILGNDVGADSIAFISAIRPDIEIIDNHNGTLTLNACRPGDYSFRYSPMSTECPQEGNAVLVKVMVERCDECSFFITEEDVPKINHCNLICNPHVVAYGEEGDTLVFSVDVIQCPISSFEPCFDFPGWLAATENPDFSSYYDVTPPSIPPGALHIEGKYLSPLDNRVESAYTSLTLEPGAYFLSLQLLAQAPDSIHFSMNAKMVDEGIIGQFSTCEDQNIQFNQINTAEGNELLLMSFETSTDTVFQRAATCFSMPGGSPNYTGLWFYPEIDSGSVHSVHLFLDEFEVIPDNFTASEDRDFYECDTLLALGGTDFCMLSNMRVRYTWKTLADSTLLEYETEIDTLGSLTVWVDEEAGDTIPELRVLPSETTTYILMREIVSEGFEDFAECFADQDSVTVTFIETFPYELSVYDTLACNLIRAFEVTGGDGPFAWDFGDGQNDTTTSGQITHLYTNAGTYTVTVTLPEHPGCLLTDTVNVSATVFTGDFSYSIEDCGEVAFLASDAHANNYSNSWTFGDGDGVDTTLASITHTYLEADSFIVVVHTIYNECNEPFTAVDTLIIPPFLPEVEASVTLDSTICNLFSFEATGNADTLTWFFPGDSIYVGDSTAFEFAEPGIYEVVLEAANECGATSITLTVVATSCDSFPCCPDSAVVLEGNLLLSDVIEAELLDEGSTTENICIDGTLTIDVPNYVFSNDTITLAANASIVIQPGSNLSINTAVLQGCEFLWNNILVQDGASLMVRSSIFRDATNAIEARNGSNIAVTGSTFENNLTGILVPGIDTGQIVIHSIVNNDFIFTAQHLKPLLTVFGPLPVFPISFSGIEVNNAVNFTVSGPSPAEPTDDPLNAATANRFKGLYCGIRAFNSNLIVSGAQFEDIVEIPGAGFGFTSAGIYFDGTNIDSTGSARSLLQTGYGDQHTDPPGSQIATPSFINCSTGIEVIQGHAKISDNRMLEMETGIRLQEGINRDMQVRDNYIEATWEGITAEVNSPSLNFVLEDNRIEIGTESIVGNAGIGIYETLIPNGNAAINNNDIDGRARNGIFLQKISKWLILENIVTNSYASGEGINILGSENSTIKCNRIGGAAIDNGRIGLSIENSTQLAVQCNDSYGFQVGVYFTGTNTTTDFRGNTMEDNDIGLYLDTTIINAQLHKGNMWAGSFGNNGARFDAMDPGDPQLSPFIVDTLDADLLWPPNIFPDGDWFLPDPGNTYFCPVGINACIAGINEELAPQETDVLVASGGILHPVLRWIAEKDLYRKMQKNPGFGAGMNVYSSFEDSRENGPVGKFYALYQGIEAAFAADSSQQTLYRIEQDTIWVLLDSMANVTTELITETGMDSVALVIIRDALFERIAAKTMIQDSLYALILGNRSLRADTLLAENAAITVQKLYESNEKSVAGIFLSAIMKGTGSFTSTQEKTLQAIASQCPWVGGDAVYAARSLYRLIEPKSYYDDTNLCGRESIPQAMQGQKTLPKEHVELEPQNEQISSETLEVVVYPNPTRDVVHIAFSSQPEGVLETRFFTLQGRSLDRQIFEVASSNYSLSTENLSAGMYFLQIRIGGQLLATKRIVIIR